MMPGDPFTGLINPNQDPKVIEAMREAAGLMILGTNNISVGLAMPYMEILVIVLSLNYLCPRSLLVGWGIRLHWPLYQS